MLENEHKLVKRAQKGDSAGFGDLYNYYFPKIYRFVFLKTSHKQEAEDITHEVFLSAWQNIESYNYRGLPFSSWLYQIARNRVIDRWRTKKDDVPLANISEDRFKITLAVEKNLDQEIAIGEIKSALNFLSEEQQSVILLRFVEELTPAEIALALNKSEGAVRLIQHRAIRQIKQILQNNGE